MAKYSIEELETLIEGAEDKLNSLKNQLRDALIEASPFKPGMIISDRRGEEAKVIHVIASLGQAAPIVVYRKKGGDWGAREYTLYSWDLPDLTKAA